MFGYVFQFHLHAYPFKPLSHNSLAQTAVTLILSVTKVLHFVLVC